jgi:hypothetical protein
MAPSTESALVKSFRDKLTKRGAFVHKTHGDPRTRRGLPDLEGCYRGYYFGIEVKLPGKEGNLTDLQAATLRKIKTAGGIGIMVTRWSQIEKVLNRIDRLKDG